MHLETFLPAFLLFLALGFVLPMVLANIADAARGASAPAGARSGAPASASSGTLFERLGGAAAVDAAVDIFYRRVLADAYINRFFEGVDKEK
ncbi:MAG: group 1 truncated hemoglobin, partial [Mariprofundaceae bacterium]